MNKKYEINKSRTYKIVLLLLLGTVITLASASVARMGLPYVCSANLSSVIEPSNRDERGIPLIYIERSIEDTGCDPKTLDGKTPNVTDNHKIIAVNLVEDILIWSAVLGIGAYTLPKVWKKL